MKKRTAILVIVLVVFIFPAGWLNLRQGVVLDGVNYVEKSRTDDSWRYAGAKGSAEMIQSGGEGAGWIEHRGVRYDVRLTWEGDAVRVGFEDGESVEGRWVGKELVDETGMPLWFHEDMIVIVTSDEVIEREISRIAIARALCEMDRGENEPLGSLAMVLIGAVVYMIGLLCTLYPEEMSMLGHRWKYDYVELSDMGRMSQVIGGYVAMAGGVVFMYLPLFLV